ncbi:extensin-related [Anaeramoeba flamelloides]|uniref:Extensin-related n=1 Tax=Anaeramoeba flamelloides TaxID=1746091 RepID=A0ABQ8X2T3_9EUKA|nr:extensin-related [Anaeramoeba flamelloides]
MENSVSSSPLSDSIMQFDPEEFLSHIQSSEQCGGNKKEKKSVTKKQFLDQQTIINSSPKLPRGIILIGGKKYFHLPKKENNKYLVKTSIEYLENTIPFHNSNSSYGSFENHFLQSCLKHQPISRIVLLKLIRAFKFETDFRKIMRIKNYLFTLLKNKNTPKSLLLTLDIFEIFHFLGLNPYSSSKKKNGKEKEKKKEKEKEKVIYIDSESEIETESENESTTKPKKKKKGKKIGKEKGTIKTKSKSKGKGKGKKNRKEGKIKTKKQNLNQKNQNQIQQRSSKRKRKLKKNNNNNKEMSNKKKKFKTNYEELNKKNNNKKKNNKVKKKKKTKKKKKKKKKHDSLKEEKPIGENFLILEQKFDIYKSGDFNCEFTPESPTKWEGLITTKIGIIIELITLISQTFKQKELQTIFQYVFPLLSIFPQLQNQICRLLEKCVNYSFNKDSQWIIYIENTLIPFFLDLMYPVELYWALIRLPCFQQRIRIFHSIVSYNLLKSILKKENKNKINFENDTTIQELISNQDQDPNLILQTLIIIKNSLSNHLTEKIVFIMKIMSLILIHLSNQYEMFDSIKLIQSQLKKIEFRLTDASKMRIRLKEQVSEVLNSLKNLKKNNQKINKLIINK